MGIKTTAWDSAEHLKTEVDIAAYLEACFEEGADDPAFLVHALGVVAWHARATCSTNGNPSFGTVLKVAGAMGYRFSLVRKPLKAVAKRGKRAAASIATTTKS